MNDETTSPGVPRAVIRRPSAVLRRREFDVETLWDETERRLSELLGANPLPDEIVTIVRTFGVRCWNSGRESVGAGGVTEVG